MIGREFIKLLSKELFVVMAQGRLIFLNSRFCDQRDGKWKMGIVAPIFIKKIFRCRVLTYINLEIDKFQS